jgi:hypothetical protein
LRHLVAELEIDAIEEVALAGIRHHEQVTELGPIGEKFAGTGDRERQVEASLPPLADPIGEFGRALQTVVGRKAAREFRLRLTDARKIQVLLIGPLADVGNFGVIDLDLVMHLVDGQGGTGCRRQEKRSC